MILGGPMDGAAFRAYVAKVLIPELAPGDGVVLGNLPAHGVSGVREAIAAAGATLLHLPPYSPDFNPIEMAFANSPRAFPASCACWNLKPAPLKAALRKTGARTFETLIEAIANALMSFTSQQCANYLANSGYRHQS
jgi:transposase